MGDQAQPSLTTNQQIGKAQRLKYCGLGLVLVGLAAITIINWYSLEQHHGVMSRRSEARSNLLQIFEAAMAIHEKRKTFELSDISELGYVPYENQPSYSYWYSVKGVPTMIPLPPGISYRTGPCDVTTPPTTVKVWASVTGFTAAAKGNPGSIPKGPFDSWLMSALGCDEWSINEAKVRENALDTLQASPGHPNKDQ